jgi:hypothetical protein
MKTENMTKLLAALAFLTGAAAASGGLLRQSRQNRAETE